MVTDLLNYGFLRLAIAGCALSAVSAGLLSVFITLKKISYMGEAFSHIAFAGIAIALLFGWSLNLTALVFVLVISFLISLISRNFHIEETNTTVIFLSVSMALGILFINLNRGYTVDLASYLFGNVLLVTRPDIWLLSGLTAVNTLFIVLFFKEILYITYNINIAQIYRIPVTTIYYSFIFLIALNIIISVKIIGVILITAQLILPGISALFITNNIRKAIILSGIISLFCSMLGLVISFMLDIPTGSAIVLALFTIFIISLSISKLSSKNG